MVLRSIDSKDSAKCTVFQQALADELKSKPGKLFPLQCDLSNQNDIMRVFEWIEKNLGCMDILVNNAAINMDITLQTGEMEDWKKIFDVNFLGLACITKEALKLMKKKGKCHPVQQLKNLKFNRCTYILQLETKL